MNHEIKQAWLDALRSGKYKQGKERLCRINDEQEKEYCCLGVLCDLAVKETNLSAFVKGRLVLYENEYSMLPKTVIKWAELDEEDGENPTVLRGAQIYKELGEKADKDAQNISLVELNDTIELNFNQIADIIEKYL